MRPDRALRRYRAAMDRAMTDRCEISRPGDGRGPWNPEIGDYDPAAPVPVAEGRCVASVLDTAERVVEIAGAPHTLRTMNVDLHYDVDGDIRVGHAFTLTESANRHLVGRAWHVVDVADGSWSGARRLTVQEELPR